MVEQNGEAQQYAQTDQLDAFVAELGKLVLGNVAAVATHQQGHHLLVFARKARQVRVLDQVGTVLVVVIVGNIQPDFMDFRRPSQQIAPVALLQVPCCGHLVEGVQRLALHARGLALVDVVALHQRVQGAFTHVLVVMAAQQVEQHAFAQGAVAVVHALQLEGVEDRLEDGQARREDGPPIGLDPFEVDLVGLAELEQLAFDRRQPLGVDLAAALADGLDRRGDGADGPGRADGLVPRQAVQGVLDAHQLQARGGVGLGVARRGDLAVAEVALGEAHAAHLQAFA